ncbi:hypothetical protein EGM92_31015, partial [Enterobacter cloacae]
VFRPHQLTQREVAFDAGTRGADTDHFLRLAQNICRTLHRLLPLRALLQRLRRRSGSGCVWRT